MTINGTILQCFHSYMPDWHGEGLWQQIEQDAPILARAGFTALWLPPMTKAWGGPLELGYSAYDLYDLGEFEQCGRVETRYGSRQQLLQAIARAQAAGLQVYGDVVLHRKHGGDGAEQMKATPVFWRDLNRPMAPAQTIKAHSRFTFPGRQQRYSTMTWKAEHFQLVNHNCLLPANPLPGAAPGSTASHRSTASPTERSAASSAASSAALLAAGGVTANSLERYPLYRLKFKAFGTDVDARMGSRGALCQRDKGCMGRGQANDPNQRYLVCELDLEMPEVVSELNAWGVWFLETTGLNGLRIDGAKHVPASFVQQWLWQLRNAMGPEREVFAMGDCWSDQVNDLHWYIAKTEGQLSLFDVPLHYNFHRASRQGGYYDLRNILKDTLVQDQPTLAVTFVDNHDSQPGQLLASPVEAWFKPLAYALILLRQEGYPCVFGADYGRPPQTLVSEAEEGLPDGDALAISGYNAPLRASMQGASRDRWLLDRLLFARSHFAYGDQYDYFEHPNLVGWSRLGTPAYPRAMAVVLSNGQGGEQWMEVGKPHAQFIDVTQHMAKSVWTNGEGWGKFGCRGSSVSVWVEVPR